MFVKKRIAAMAIAGALSFSMLLSSCTPVGTGTASSGTDSGSTGSTDGASSAAPVATGKYAGTTGTDVVTIDLGAEPPDMNTVTTQDAVSFNLIRHLYTGLVTLDENDVEQPGVAEKWTVSDDGLVYTFNLRKDFKWSNGDPVTAKDFKFAWSKLADPKTAAMYMSFAAYFKNGSKVIAGKAGTDELGIKVIDDYTLEVTLENPTTYFVPLLAFGVFMPVNEKAYTEYGDTYGKDADKMCTNGPYKMESWAHESEIILVKNQDYPDKDTVGLIPTIKCTMITDANTRMNMFASNELDMFEPGPEQCDQLKTDSHPASAYDNGSVWYLQYNFNSKFTANKNIRLAISYAMNSQGLVDAVVKNQSSISTQIVPKAVMGNKDKFINEVGDLFTPYDVEKAKQYLDAGMKEMGIAKASDITVNLLCGNTTNAQRQGAYVQESVASALGIKVEIFPLAFKARLERMNNNDFDIVFAGWSPDYNDPMTYMELFQTGNPQNNGQWSNKAYDENIEKARVEPDRDKRFGYLAEADKIICDDMAIFPMYFEMRDFVTSSKFKNVRRTAFQDINMLYATVE